MSKILVVDDEKSIREFFHILLDKEGFENVCVGSGEEALNEIDRSIFDLVISDVSMPGMSGEDLLESVKTSSPETDVILITAYGNTEQAVAAMKKGAADYILKPFKVEEIKHVIRQTLERTQLYKQNALLKQELRRFIGTGNIVGVSEPIRKTLELIYKCAQNRSTILISGESGTGKELVARSIHDQSDQKDAPFISVNCGAIPETLIESELFGYMKGAFTGAQNNKRGLLEAAQDGTFFFDEVGELPPSMQVKLLRVLQERRIRRIGGTEDTAIQCRIIAATNKNLAEEVKQGRFRQDLFYRLNVMQITVPALRERIEDVPVLIQFFIEKKRENFNQPIKRFATEAVARLKRYHFPGNVRELENIVEQSMAHATGETVLLDDLPSLEELEMHSSKLGGLFKNGKSEDLPMMLESYEKDLIQAALDQAGGVKTEAAKLLNISFRSLRYRLSKLGLE